MAPQKAATARERARAELTREIKEEARRQLAATGAHGLSLRAVAKELGMVSSALYRYYPSRDDLLTALIIDAYNALGEAAEGAIAGAGPAVPARERWLAACHAIRDWARSNLHQYALIYGSPVPGYRAPEATIGPAARVPLAFAGVLEDAGAAGEITPFAGALPVTGALAKQAAALSAALAISRAPTPDEASPEQEAPEQSSPGQTSPGPAAPDQTWRGQASPGGAAPGPAAPGPASLDQVAVAGVPPDALVRAVIAWTQLYGMISFELFGQFVGSFEPADALFAHASEQLAAFVGLR